MTAFKNQDQAVSSVIEIYRRNDYSESVLIALKELLIEKLNGTEHYDELALYFDNRLQANGVHYDTANVYRLMMNALLSFSEFCKED